MSTLISQRIGATLLLGGVALVLGLFVSVVVALVAVRFHDRLVDHGLRVITLTLTGIPTFVLGLLVLQYVVLGLGWGSVISDGSLSSVWLPAMVLAGVGIAGWSRPLRSLLLDAGAAPYARTMQARGASQSRVLMVHALPNAFVPFLALLGLGIGGLIGGAPIVESVFSWPGLGAQAIQSVQQRDIPVIQAFVLLSTLGYVLASLLVDVLAGRLDPRRRRAGAAA
ncbi:MAG: ABC transporter permease [Ilumatobacteraceae bacterium]